MNKAYFIYIFPLLLLGFGCNLNRPIDIELPPLESAVVVECYLRPGQPFLLTLTESVGYFEPATISYVKGARVSIRFDNQEINLSPVAFPIPDGIPSIEILKPLLGDSLLFYNSSELVPAEYETDFFLDIVTADGERLTATTRIPEPVLMDTIEWGFDDDDSLAFVLSRFQDNASVMNFYRHTLHKGRLVATAEQDFSVDDRIFNGGQAAFGTDFHYIRGDTLIFSLYHIPQNYYDFLETKDAAITANLSPFAQPAVVISNIQGGMGIFTGFTLDRQQIVIE